MKYRLYLLFCIQLFISFYGNSQDKGIKLVFESVYVHTDRSSYAAGEDIWFKIYLVNSQTHTLINSSNSLYIELISPDSKIEERKIIRVDKGVGNGDFKLNDSLGGGIYRIRAYSNWMRNFGENFIFEKRIEIYSSFKQAGQQVSNLNHSGQNLESLSNASEPKGMIMPYLRFFPEGGSLIENVDGILALKSEFASGKGIQAKGSIFSSSGKIISEFETNEVGLGMLMFHPVPGESYFAKGSFVKGGTFNAPLPQALLKGVSINVRNTDSLLKVVISTNPSTLSDYQNKEISLLFKNKGKAYFTKSITLVQLQTSITFSKTSFPGGISSITLYDPSGKPQCERLFYTDSKEKVIASIETDQKVYSSKGKVTLKINTKNQNGQPVKANFSLAAVDAGLVPEGKENIISYLNLQSEIRGDIEKIEEYFDEGNDKRKQQMELLLLTQGWRDFIWKRLADSILRISYAWEKGISISGRVTDIAKNKKNMPIAGSNITLFIPTAKPSSLYSSKTDSLGRYFFDGLEFYGEKVLSLTSRNNKGEKLGLIMLDSLYQKPLPVDRQILFYTDTTANPDIFQVKLAEREKARYKLSDTVKLKEVVIKPDNTLRLFDMMATSFGYPDEVYNIDPKITIIKI